MKKLIAIAIAFLVLCSLVSCAHEHEFSEWEIVKEPTCEEAGLKTRSCRCGEIQEQEIPALGHTPVMDEAVAPTCEETGLTEGKHCSVCNAVLEKQNEVPSLGHSYKEEIVKEPTCEEKGEKKFTCEVCGKTKTEDIPAKGHDYDDGVITTKPTCEKEGVKTYTCKTCGKTKTEVIRATGHDYNDGVVTKQSTCTQQGTKVYTCKVCGHKKTDSVPLKNHTNGDAVITKKPTCTEKGIKTYTCKVCGHKTTVNIPALGHKWQNNICTVCGAKKPIELSMTSSEKAAASKVHYISQRSVQYDDHRKAHTLLFTFLDSSQNQMDAPAVVEVSIVNENKETVYSAVHTIDKYDFSTWTSWRGQNYLASIYIDEKDIKPGTSSKGKIYFKVYNKGYFTFDEYSLNLLHDLPVKSITIKLPATPVVIHTHDYRDRIESTCNITNIRYEVSDDDIYFYFSGEKIYDIEGPRYSRGCHVGWKLYDDEGYLVETGTFYSDGLSMGEKFRDEKSCAWDVVKPGREYKLVILDSDG